MRHTREERTTKKNNKYKNQIWENASRKDEKMLTIAINSPNDQEKKTWTIIHGRRTKEKKMGDNKNNQ